MEDQGRRTFRKLVKPVGIIVVFAQALAYPVSMRFYKWFAEFFPYHAYRRHRARS